jgi:hypothetical protein
MVLVEEIKSPCGRRSFEVVRVIQTYPSTAI